MKTISAQWIYLFHSFDILKFGYKRDAMDVSTKRGLPIDKFQTTSVIPRNYPVWLVCVQHPLTFS